MKPHLFIGSSVENLEVANALQQNLEYDANVTVWNQGVFNLSSNSIDDLLKVLERTDFGIFIFNPDDVSKIRNKEYSTVRDNIIFELGLFIGKLGRSRVFYIIPRSIKDLRLPTDLIGLNPGTYDDGREDNNLLASLGPFSNQIRKILKEFTFENLADLQDESPMAKKIAIEKKDCWEYLLACQLLDDKLETINQSYDELEQGLTIQRKRAISGEEFFNFFESSLATHKHTLKLINKTFEELNKSFGPPGIAGKSLEIKNAVDRIIQLCKEQLSWEFELESLEPPEELFPTKRKMQGWSKSYIDQINNISIKLREAVEQSVYGKLTGNQSIVLTLEQTAELDTVVDDFRNFLNFN